MSSPDVIVVGAGVLGLCTAAELALRGRSVTVIDPGVTNASAIAAGMIAPAMESLLDAAKPERAVLLRAAADLWPTFAEATGIELHRNGTTWIGSDAAAVVDRLHSLGFSADLRPEGAFTNHDSCLDPRTAMTRLVEMAGITLITSRVDSLTPAQDGWTLTCSDNRAFVASTVVIATGAAASVPGTPAAVSTLIDAIMPIRGQITVLPTTGEHRVVRTQGAYVVSTPDGTAVGATMEVGLRDLRPDVEPPYLDVAARLSLADLMAVDRGVHHVGIRGATSDGLPLAGASGVPGLHLALAPRRNGWLLGPLVAQTVADGIEGREPGIWSTVLDPLRFV